MTQPIDRNCPFIVRLDVIPDSGEDLTEPTITGGLKLDVTQEKYSFTAVVTVDPIERCIVAVVSQSDVAKMLENTPYHFLLYTTLAGITSPLLHADVILAGNDDYQ